MLLLFKSGWIHFAFGSLILLAGVFVVDVLTGKEVGEGYSFLQRTDRLTLQSMWQTAVGLAGVVGFYVAATLIGALVAPMRFLRWWLSSLNRIYGRITFFRALALALMAGLLHEPLFRLGIQPVLTSEIDPVMALAFIAAASAAASWAPGISLLALAAFFESAWFGWLYLESQNPFVPVISHGLSEFCLAIGLGRLESMGLTHIPPPKPREWIPVRSGEGRNR